MTTQSVGIVGAGSIVQSVHLPVLASMSSVNVAWVADANEQRAQRVAKAYGVPHARLTSDLNKLPNCDVVLLAIPLQGRAAYFDAFALKGTPVLAEKPFALNLAQHEHVVRSFESFQLGCGYMRRFYASNRLVRLAIAEQWFGPLRSLRLSEGGRITKTGVDISFQDLAAAEGGGVLLNLGCHLVDLAFYLTAATDYRIEQAKVVADGATDRKVKATIELDNVNGVSGQSCRFELEVSWLDRQDNRLQAQFDHVALAATTAPSATVDVLTVPSMNLAGNLQTAERGASTSNQAFYLEWQAFLAGIQTKKLSEIAACHSIVTARLMDDLLADTRKK